MKPERRQAAEEMDREAARGSFRGPLHGIPLGIKDICRRGGLADAGRLAHSRRPRGRGRCGDRRTAARRGGDHPGQDGDDGVRQLRSAADAQSLEPGAHARRLQQRLGRGRGAGHVPGGDRLADGRLDHPAGQLLRRGRLQADLWPREPGRHRAAGAQHGSSGADCPQRGRPGAAAGRDRPAGSERYVAGAFAAQRAAAAGTAGGFLSRSGLARSAANR